MTPNIEGALPPHDLDAGIWWCLWGDRVMSMDALFVAEASKGDGARLHTDAPARLHSSAGAAAFDTALDLNPAPVAAQVVRPVVDRDTKPENTTTPGNGARGAPFDRCQRRGAEQAPRRARW